MLYETKLNKSFPTSQFSIPDYERPYLLDRNQHGGWYTLIYKKPLKTSKNLLYWYWGFDGRIKFEKKELVTIMFLQSKSKFYYTLYGKVRTIPWQPFRDKLMTQLSQFETSDISVSTFICINNENLKHQRNC